MALDFLGGGVMTFVLIAIVVIAVAFIWRSLFGSKSPTNLVGSIASGIGSVASGIGKGALEVYKIRANSKKEKGKEGEFSGSLNNAEKIANALKSEAERIAAEQNFNQERVKTMQQQLSDLSKELENEAKINQELIKIDSEEIQTLTNMINEKNNLFSQQNQIEQELNSLKEKLTKRNLTHQEIDQAFEMAEKIKSSSGSLTTFENQYKQLQQKIKDLLEVRTDLFSQGHTLFTEIEELLKNDAPLSIISELQDKLKKLIAFIQELKNPTNSIDQILSSLDPILQQIESELNQVRERIEAEKGILGRIKIVIQDDIAKGNLSKK